MKNPQKIKGENAKSGADEWKTIEATVFERGKKQKRCQRKKKGRVMQRKQLKNALNCKCIQKLLAF